MGFDDIEDFKDLDEIPAPFEEDIDLPFEEAEGGGVSRTFKIVGAVLVLAVVGIVAVLVVLALQGGGKLSANEKTATAVVAMNATTQKDFENTQTAIALAAAASQTAVQSFNLTSTVTQQAFETQQAQMATDTANTATAQFHASETAAAQQTQQAATSAALTATYAANHTLTGQLVGRDNAPYGGVTILLFKDDGDGQFNPLTDLPPFTPVPGSGAATPEPGAGAADGQGGEATSGSGANGSVAGATPINYGDTVQGTLTGDTPNLWSFAGSAGDVVSINVAADPGSTQLDLFMVLIGPDGTNLIEDDDSGEATDAAILGFPLPAAGAYSIRVSTVAGPGSYTLSLSTTVVAPAGDGNTGYMPRPASEIVLVVRRQGGTPTPTPTPQNLDEFITGLITGSNGEFDFGVLEPGVYWLVVEYNSLPDNLKQQIPPTEQIYIMVNVPVEGPITFTVGVEPTATPNPLSFTQTAEAIKSMTAAPGSVSPPALVTLTNTPEGTIPGTGLLSDIAGNDGSLDGTSGLAILAIAAVGLVAVVFIARKLRMSA